MPILFIPPPLLPPPSYYNFERPAVVITAAVDPATAAAEVLSPTAATDWAPANKDPTATTGPCIVAATDPAMTPAQNF